jgi:competence protein ComEC
VQRPFVWTTAALLAGAAIASSVAPPDRFLPSIFLSFWLLALLLTLLRRRWPAMVLTLACSCLLGACLYVTRSYQLQTFDLLAQRYAFDWSTPVELKGLITEWSPTPEVGGRATFLLEAEAIEKPERDSGSWIPVSGRATINWYGSSCSFHEGDTVQVSGRMKLLKGFKNPQIFDYEHYMHCRGIYTRLIARGSNAVTLVHAADLSVFENWRHLLRSNATAVLSRSARSKETDAFLSAILLGERGRLTEEMKGWFKETGTFHILAISGLHVGLVYLIISLMLAPFPLGMKSRAAVALVMVWLYAAITGAGVPVTRASLMLTLVLAGYLLDREGDFLTAVAVAAFILFVLEPASIEDVSFQLSFVAVVLLCSFEPLFSEKLYPLLQQKLPQIPSAIMHKLAVTLFASVVVGTGLMPIIAYHFNQVSLVFPIANLLVVPLLSLALALGFVCLVVGFFSITAAGVVGIAAELVCQAIFTIVGFLSSIPYSSIHVASPSLWLLGMVGAGIFFLWWKTEWKKKAALLGSLAAIGLLTSFAGRWFSEGIFRVTFLDVGEADACLLEFPEQKTMLVDTGFATRFLDCGEDLIAPFFWKKNIRNIDLLVLTHADGDHCGGTPFLLENFRVRRLILPDSPQMLAKLAPLIRTAEQRSTKVEFHAAGDVLPIGPQTCVKVLSPPAGVLPGQFSDNELSLVLKVTSNDLSILLTGDAGSETFRWLRSSSDLLQSTILKAPHHGLLSGFSKRFLRQVSPEAVVISGSVFRANDRIEERVRRYACLAPLVLATQSEGAVTIETSGASYDIKTCRGPYTALP